MKSVPRMLFYAVLVLLIKSPAHTAEKILLHLTGDYLAFSYDFNQLYGENVRFQFHSYEVTCHTIKIDISSKTFYAAGNVELNDSHFEFKGDELIFLPQENTGLLITYGDKIIIKSFGTTNNEALLKRRDNIASANIRKIRSSLFYFTGQDMSITADLDVYGKNVALFIEGFESVGLKHFKLSEGIKHKRSGFSFDKLWYNKTQGLIGKASYVQQIENKMDSLTELNYEEHSVLKNYQGLKRQLDLRTRNAFQLNESMALRLDADYNSSSLWNTRLSLEKKWAESSRFGFNIMYNKPINQKGETWFGLESGFKSKKWGILDFTGNVEMGGQVLSSLKYERELLKNVAFNFKSNYSKILIRGSSHYSEIFKGDIDLSYTSRLFNLSTNYFLNNDLFGHQKLSQPQMRFNINPFEIYGGLLTISLDNIFIWNSMILDNAHQDNYSNNTIFSLTAKPIFLRKTLSLDFHIALEQFLELKGRNFTSAGLILNMKQKIGPSMTLEGFYSFQSRRRTQGWFIQGTTSQDLSAVFRVDLSNKLNGWISFSFNPKTNRWRQSFVDISLSLLKSWKLHSLINYDFLLKKLTNVDLYLIRDAGRFQLRFIWRSISRQILIELVPN